MSGASINAAMLMRANKQGCEATIAVVDKKYYTYADKGYSITNILLNQQDMEVLSEVQKCAC